MDLILGTRRTFSQNSSEVVLSDLGHRDLENPRGSHPMEGGRSEDLVEVKIFFGHIVKVSHQRNHKQLRANCPAALRSCILDQQGR